MTSGPWSETLRPFIVHPIGMVGTDPDAGWKVRPKSDSVNVVTCAETPSATVASVAPGPRGVSVTLADGKERTIGHMMATTFWPNADHWSCEIPLDTVRASITITCNDTSGFAVGEFGISNGIVIL